MLAYLLDENISYVIAEQLVRSDSSIRVESIYRWQGGAFVGQAAASLLQAAQQDGLTLVTYDLKTIPPLLSELATESEAHAGVLFIDGSTIRSSDFGGLVRALLAHRLHYHQENWANRIAFLTAA